MKKLILSIYLMAGTSVAAQHVIVVKDSTTLEKARYMPLSALICVFPILRPVHREMNPSLMAVFCMNQVRK